MKVLIVTQYFWPENFRINDLATGMKDRGHEITVLTGKPNYPSGRFYGGYGFFSKRREMHEGMKVIRAPLLPRGRAGGFRLALNYFSFAFAAALSAAFSCRDKYDVIFVYAPSPITVALPAIVLKWICGVPIMLWVQDLWPESVSATGGIRSAWILRLIERMVKFIYRGTDRILVQSEAFRPLIERLGVSLERITYFPNSAEELYRPVTLPSDAVERTLVPAGFCVMYAGNIGSAQSFETILSAAERLRLYPDIRWVVLGDGRMASWVRAQVTERGLSGTVHMLGRHPLESMPRFFSLADAMLVTLKNEPILELTIPGRVQSYLACGKPIIAGINGEGARIVREAAAGLTPSAENPEELANAVLEMYRMSGAEREAMGARGRQYFEIHFERNVLLERLDGWLNDLGKGVALCKSRS
ncbi:MAG: glycosyltransferase WbuB [Gammaproteobacteria bacterium RBG_16_51_14]|nr:MAG: glycosyltransferase WbuB [Gammaproteobacteria bacterium RBG_16_51_14]